MLHAYAPKGSHNATSVTLAGRRGKRKEALVSQIPNNKSQNSNKSKTPNFNGSRLHQDDRIWNLFVGLFEFVCILVFEFCDFGY
jgi:hypothetical protein